MQAAVLKRLDDRDWAVRQQLAASLGALPAGARERAVVRCSSGSRRSDRDGRRAERSPRQRDRCARAADGWRVPRRRRSARPPSRWSPRRSSAARRTARCRSCSRRSATEARPAWQRGRAAARRRGGAARRGGARERRQGRRGQCSRGRGLPCPTCPGGRAGPGGAYAFPQAPPAAGGADAARGSSPSAAAGGRGRGPCGRCA